MDPSQSTIDDDINKDSSSDTLGYIDSPPNPLVYPPFSSDGLPSDSCESRGVSLGLTDGSLYPSSDNTSYDEMIGIYPASLSTFGGGRDGVSHESNLAKGRLPSAPIRTGESRSIPLTTRSALTPLENDHHHRGYSEDSEDSGPPDDQQAAEVVPPPKEVHLPELVNIKPFARTKLLVPQLKRSMIPLYEDENYNLLQEVISYTKELPLNPLLPHDDVQKNNSNPIRGDEDDDGRQRHGQFNRTLVKIPSSNILMLLYPMSMSLQHLVLPLPWSILGHQRQQLSMSTVSTLISQHAIEIVFTHHQQMAAMQRSIGKTTVLSHDSHSYGQRRGLSGDISSNISTNTTTTGTGPLPLHITPNSLVYKQVYSALALNISRSYSLPTTFHSSLSSEDNNILRHMMTLVQPVIDQYFDPVYMSLIHYIPYRDLTDAAFVYEILHRRPFIFETVTKNHHGDGSGAAMQSSDALQSEPTSNHLHTGDIDSYRVSPQVVLGTSTDTIPSNSNRHGHERGGVETSDRTHQAKAKKMMKIDQPQLTLEDIKQSVVPLFTPSAFPSCRLTIFEPTLANIDAHLQWGRSGMVKPPLSSSRHGGNIPTTTTTRGGTIPLQTNHVDGITISDSATTYNLANQLLCRQSEQQAMDTIVTVIPYYHIFEHSNVNNPNRYHIPSQRASNHTEYSSHYDGGHYDHDENDDQNHNDREFFHQHLTPRTVSICSILIHLQSHNLVQFFESQIKNLDLVFSRIQLISLNLKTQHVQVLRAIYVLFGFAICHHYMDVAWLYLCLFHSTNAMYTTFWCHFQEISVSIKLRQALLKTESDDCLNLVQNKPMIMDPVSKVYYPRDLLLCCVPIIDFLAKVWNNPQFLHESTQILLLQVQIISLIQTTIKTQSKQAMMLYYTPRLQKMSPNDQKDDEHEKDTPIRLSIGVPSPLDITDCDTIPHQDSLFPIQEADHANTDDEHHRTARSLSFHDLPPYMSHIERSGEGGSLRNDDTPHSSAPGAASHTSMSSEQNVTILRRGSAVVHSQDQSAQSARRPSTQLQRIISSMLSPIDGVPFVILHNTGSSSTSTSLPSSSSSSSSSYSYSFTSPTSQLSRLNSTRGSGPGEEPEYDMLLLNHDDSPLIHDYYFLPFTGDILKIPQAGDHTHSSTLTALQQLNADHLRSQKHKQTQEELYRRRSDGKHPLFSLHSYDTYGIQADFVIEYVLPSTIPLVKHHVLDGIPPREFSSSVARLIMMYSKVLGNAMTSFTPKKKSITTAPTTTVPVPASATGGGLTEKEDHQIIPQTVTILLKDNKPLRLAIIGMLQTGELIRHCRRNAVLCTIDHIYYDEQQRRITLRNNYAIMAMYYARLILGLFDDPLSKPHSQSDNHNDEHENEIDVHHDKKNNLNIAKKREKRLSYPLVHHIITICARHKTVTAIPPVLRSHEGKPSLSHLWFGSQSAVDHHGHHQDEFHSDQDQTRSAQKRNKNKSSGTNIPTHDDHLVYPIHPLFNRERRLQLLSLRNKRDGHRAGRDHTLVEGDDTNLVVFPPWLMPTFLYTDITDRDINIYDEEEDDDDVGQAPDSRQQHHADANHHDPKEKPIRQQDPHSMHLADIGHSTPNTTANGNLKGDPNTTTSASAPPQYATGDDKMPKTTPSGVVLYELEESDSFDLTISFDDMLSQPHRLEVAKQHGHSTNPFDVNMISSPTNPFAEEYQNEEKNEGGLSAYLHRKRKELQSEHTTEESSPVNRPEKSPKFRSTNPFDDDFHDDLLYDEVDELYNDVPPHLRPSTLVRSPLTFAFASQSTLTEAVDVPVVPPTPTPHGHGKVPQAHPLQVGLSGQDPIKHPNPSTPAAVDTPAADSDAAATKPLILYDEPEDGFTVVLEPPPQATLPSSASLEAVPYYRHNFYTGMKSTPEYLHNELLRQAREKRKLEQQIQAQQKTSDDNGDELQHQHQHNIHTPSQPIAMPGCDSSQTAAGTGEPTIQLYHNHDQDNHDDNDDHDSDMNILHPTVSNVSAFSGISVVTNTFSEFGDDMSSPFFPSLEDTNQNGNKMVPGSKPVATLVPPPVVVTSALDIERQQSTGPGHKNKGSTLSSSSSSTPSILTTSTSSDSSGKVKKCRPELNLHYTQPNLLFLCGCGYDILLRTVRRNHAIQEERKTKERYLLHAQTIGSDDSQHHHHHHQQQQQDALHSTPGDSKIIKDTENTAVADPLQDHSNQSQPAQEPENDVSESLLGTTPVPSPALPSGDEMATMTYTTSQITQSTRCQTLYSIISPLLFSSNIVSLLVLTSFSKIIEVQSLKSLKLDLASLYRFQQEETKTDSETAPQTEDLCNLIENDIFLLRQQQSQLLSGHLTKQNLTKQSEDNQRESTQIERSAETSDNGSGGGGEFSPFLAGGSHQSAITTDTLFQLIIALYQNTFSSITETLPPIVNNSSLSRPSSSSSLLTTSSSQPQGSQDIHDNHDHLPHMASHIENNLVPRASRIYDKYMNHHQTLSAAYKKSEIYFHYKALKMSYRYESQHAIASSMSDEQSTDINTDMIASVNLIRDATSITTIASSYCDILNFISSVFSPNLNLLISSRSLFDNISVESDAMSQTQQPWGSSVDPQSDHGVIVASSSSSHGSQSPSLSSPSSVMSMGIQLSNALRFPQSQITSFTQQISRSKKDAHALNGMHQLLLPHWYYPSYPFSEKIASFVLSLAHEGSFFFQLFQAVKECHQETVHYLTTNGFMYDLLSGLYVPHSSKRAGENHHHQDPLGGDSDNDHCHDHSTVQDDSDSLQQMYDTEFNIESFIQEYCQTYSQYGGSDPMSHGCFTQDSSPLCTETRKDQKLNSSDTDASVNEYDGDITNDDGDDDDDDENNNEPFTVHVDQDGNIIRSAPPVSSRIHGKLSHSHSHSHTQSRSQGSNSRHAAVEDDLNSSPQTSATISSLHRSSTLGVPRPGGGSGAGGNRQAYRNSAKVVRLLYHFARIAPSASHDVSHTVPLDDVFESLRSILFHILPTLKLSRSYTDHFTHHVLLLTSYFTHRYLYCHSRSPISAYTISITTLADALGTIPIFDSFLFQQQTYQAKLHHSEQSTTNSPSLDHPNHTAVSSYRTRGDFEPLLTFLYTRCSLFQTILSLPLSESHRFQFQIRWQRALSPRQLRSNISAFPQGYSELYEQMALNRCVCPCLSCGGSIAFTGQRCSCRHRSRDACLTRSPYHNPNKICLLTALLTTTDPSPSSMQPSGLTPQQLYQPKIPQSLSFFDDNVLNPYLPVILHIQKLNSCHSPQQHLEIVSQSVKMIHSLSAIYRQLTYLQSCEYEDSFDQALPTPKTVSMAPTGDEHQVEPSKTTTTLQHAKRKHKTSSRNATRKLLNNQDQWWETSLEKHRNNNQQTDITSMSHTMTTFKQNLARFAEDACLPRPVLESTAGQKRDDIMSDKPAFPFPLRRFFNAKCERMSDFIYNDLKKIPTTTHPTKMRDLEPPDLYHAGGADDIIVILIYVLIHTDLHNINEKIKIMTSYCNTMPMETTEYSYRLGTFQTAYNVVLSEPFSKYQHYFE